MNFNKTLQLIISFCLVNYFTLQKMVVNFGHLKAPGERFELSYPCEYALYGIVISRRAPYQARRPRHIFRLNNCLEADYIIRYSKEIS